MEKVELTRTKAVTLYIAMQGYIKAVGENSDKLAWACKHIMEHTPNEEFIEAHDKKSKKYGKDLQRAVAKLENKYAMTYLEGDKKGSHILDDKGNLIFSVDNKNVMNDAIYELNDKYEEDMLSFMKEKVEFYIQEASVVPEKLSVEFKTSLALLIPTSDDQNGSSL